MKKKITQYVLLILILQTLGCFRCPEELFNNVWNVSHIINNNKDLLENPINESDMFSSSGKTGYFKISKQLNTVTFNSKLTDYQYVNFKYEKINENGNCLINIISKDSILNGKYKISISKKDTLFYNKIKAFCILAKMESENTTIYMKRYEENIE